jgi:hypothetical protein
MDVVSILVVTAFILVIAVTVAVLQWILGMSYLWACLIGAPVGYLIVMVFLFALARIKGSNSDK